MRVVSTSETKTRFCAVMRRGHWLFALLHCMQHKHLFQFYSMQLKLGQGAQGEEREEMYERERLREM